MAETKHKRRTRICPTCNETKEFSSFPRASEAIGNCRICFNKQQKLERGRKPLPRTFVSDYGDDVLKPCPECKTEKPKSQFYRNNRNKKDGLHIYYIPCLNEINRLSNIRRRTRLRTETPKLWWALCVHNVRRADARKLGIPFEVTAEWLASVAPDLCPVLGVPLEYPTVDRVGRSDWSASVDKFQPGLGYVPSNVVVISSRANTIKSNGTVAEHAKVLAWMLSHESVSDDDRARVASILGIDWIPPLMKAA